MTTIVYKITKQDLTTYKGFQYVQGVPATAPGVGPLCSKGWLHAYSNPLLALLMNPIHAAITNPRLWRAEALLPLLDDNGRKCGTAQLTLLKELTIPALTTEQRVTFAIVVAQAVCKERKNLATWNVWAENWLLNKDRGSSAAASAAAAAAYAAAAAAYAAAARYAAYAARYAAAAAAAAANVWYADAADADAAAAAASAAAVAAAPIQKALLHLTTKWPHLLIYEGVA